MQAVEIESVKSAFSIGEDLSVVVFAQPADEIEHIGVSPHPLWKALEAAQCFHAINVVATPWTKRLIRYASGQSASTATALKPR